MLLSTRNQVTMSSNNSKNIDINKDKVNIAVYHSPCKDGEACKYIITLKTTEIHGSEAAESINFVPYNYDGTNVVFEKVKEMVVGKNILFADCTLPSEQMDEIKNLANKCLVIDHHGDLDHLEPACIQIWKLAFPDKEVPKILSLVGSEDRGDPYKLKTRSEMMAHEAFLFGYKFKPIPNFNSWAEYCADQSKVDALIETSRKEIDALLPELDAAIESAVYCNQIIDGQELNVAYVENQNFRLINILGFDLCHKGYDLVSSYKYENGEFVHSLRTQNGGTISAAKIAKYVDATGGGHFNAARCVILTDRLPNDFSFSAEAKKY